VSATARIAAEAVDLSRGGRAILRQAYVDAVPGTITALVGRIGAGKTSLLRVLAGRMRPDRGQVRWEGERLRRPSLEALARAGLALLPDHAWLAPQHTLGVQLALAARVSGGDWRAAVARVGATRVDRRPGDLSTGERRLGELALAVSLGATALVLDEPFRELDPLHRERLGACLRDLADDGCAVLFADHDVASVLAWADRLFAIEAGATRFVPGFRERRVVDWYVGWGRGG